ncbi:flavin reductase [Novosphingobium sp. RD2P27]|uniref:Flavin reductase n=1 Tax=Novosphingobium kalidii TaxID=3230299 RepID=A0ABV2D259_9SPHN
MQTSTIDKAQFRTAMSRLGAAVNIITTADAQGWHGMTASAVCSVSDEPASLLVCINRAARLHAMIVHSGTLCVNVLAGAHEALSGVFASRGLTMDERFAQAEWTPLQSGAPALVGALCNFGCRVASVSEMGTHSVFLCQVEELRVDGEGEALVYCGRNYHHLPVAVAA